MSLGSPQSLPPDVHPIPKTWRRVFWIGLLLYAISIVLTALTANPHMFPTMILLGNFLVPVTFLTFLYERSHLSALTFPQLLLCLFYGGVIGIFTAGFIEPLLMSHGATNFLATPTSRIGFTTALKVGLIEELAKILAVIFVARRLHPRSQLNGVLVGTAVGMGFAALESAGYSFAIFLDVFAKAGASPFTQETLAIFVTVMATAVRSLLTPFGHAVWTAILTAVLFRESTSTRFRLTGPLVGTYLGVALLHGLWDNLPGLIPIPFVNLLPTIGVALAGIFILKRVWRNSLHRASLSAYS
ncbi:PrsW family intramembrane metalloprotease [filamentous cyanobacterium CCP5]|nr:PrsW family intramembrane metalloprotease [filamentous cyanobacterium CCP5]